MKSEHATVNELAKACAHSTDAAEWQEFLRRCTPLVSLVAVRVCRMWMNRTQPATVDDIVQEVFLKLCEQERRILRSFEPRGEDSFLGLLRIVTTSVGNDYFRRQNSAKRGGKVVTVSLEDDSGPSTAASTRQTARMQQTVLLAQLDRRLAEAPGEQAERDRAIFWLYYRQGFTAEEIAALPSTGLTAKGVETALRRIAGWLRAQIEAPGSAEQSGGGG